MITALARIEGRPVGVIANNPRHLGGAIDVEAADKCARFMQLCNAHGLPIVSLTDTPGFMVGPDIEAQAQVRHACRMFVVAAHLSVPFFAVVLRKGYGLGAQAMTAGGFDAPVFTVAWPTGEFGAMGLEGAVKLGFRKELEAAAPGAERDALYQKLVAQQYENGQAMNMAATLEIDAVIDPAADPRLAGARARFGGSPAGCGQRFRRCLVSHFSSRNGPLRWPPCATTRLRRGTMRLCPTLHPSSRARSPGSRAVKCVVSCSA